MHRLHSRIAVLEKEKETKERENNDLENELMLLRNETNSHTVSLRKFTAAATKGRPRDTSAQSALSSISLKENAENKSANHEVGYDNQDAS